MKKIIFISIGLLILLFGAVTVRVYSLSEFGHWKQAEINGYAIFNGDISYQEVLSEANKKVKVIYDSDRIGLFCSDVDDQPQQMVCVPFILNRKEIGANDKLADVMEVPLLSDALMIKTEVKNAFPNQELSIMAYSLNAPCAKDKSCAWKKMPLYKRSIF